MKFGLSEETLEKIHKVFAAHPAIEKAVLYGSRAKGNFRPGSDIDLAFSGAGLQESVINRWDAELEELLRPYRFDLSIHEEITHPELIEHIGRVGKIFYERGMSVY